jgi:hypothetical protein
MYTHAQVANELGQPWDTMLLLNNGDTSVSADLPDAKLPVPAC